MADGTQIASCEPCKKKKCKCDRQLPHCAQCSASPSSCKYIESNKRGIPSGYLNALEQRLSETESALYAIFSSLQSSDSTEAVLCDLQAFEYRAPPSVATIKASRMQQWLKYPIKDLAGIERWWQEAMCHSNNVRPKATTTISPSNEPDPTRGNIGASPSRPASRISSSATYCETPRVTANSLPYPVASRFVDVNTENPPIHPNSSTVTQLDSINVEPHGLAHESASTTANMSPSLVQNQRAIQEHVFLRPRETPQPERPYRKAQRLSQSMYHVYY